MRGGNGGRTDVIHHSINGSFAIRAGRWKLLLAPDSGGWSAPKPGSPAAKAGIRTGWGQDCVLDPWYSLGTADMLDVAFMGLHVAQMSSPTDMRTCFDMVTKINAEIMGLDHLGLAVGKSASLVVLDAGNPIEAVRLRAERLCVVAKGKVVAEREKRDTALSIKGRPATINRRHILPRQS